MSLLRRINRLADQFGADDKPKGIMITTDGRRHGITFAPDGSVSLCVPWDPAFVGDPKSDVMLSLKPEQRALIGPHDQVCVLVLPPNGRGDLFVNPNTRRV